MPAGTPTGTVSMRPAARGDDGSAIRAAVEGTVMPDHVREAISEAYRELGAGPVAVRSSATAEDLPGAAFAGQQDTFLGVDGEPEVLDAVRRCWASLWTDRAIAYRRRLGIDGSSVAIAVVVQRMVDAEYAGVMFTADPVTGERGVVVIDAALGLGEAVVSGTVTPDHYVVDAAGAVRERTSELLPEAVVTELAGLGRSIEELFGSPQDVEWARGDGRTWLTQARPMTALPPPPIRLNRVQRMVGRQLLDYVTVRPYPLDMSAWTGPGVGRLVERMLFEIPGLRVQISHVLPERDGVVDRFVPPFPRPTRAVLTLPFRVLPRIRRYHPGRWKDDERLARFRRQVLDLSELDPATLDWAELVAVPRRALAATDLVGDLRVDYLPRAGVDLVRLRGTLALLRRQGLFPLLILGGRTRTEDANQALEHLAERVRADPALRAAVTGPEPSAALERIERDATFAGFRAEFQAFRAEYGHRETTSLLLMSAPTSGEEPASLLGLIGVLVEEPPQTPSPDRAALAQQRLLEHPLVRLTRRDAAVRRQVRAARAGIAFREDTHFYATAALPALRAALLEAGERLAAAGVLAERDDVLHLRLEEIEAVEDPDRLPAGDAERLGALARKRAARRAELAGVPLIAAAALFPPQDRHADVLVSGAAASAGLATGAVRVVRTTADFGTLRSGEVLVCPYTNPTWTPLFQRAAAVVVDSGGLGSHAAIVAREYGIPAVMGTGRGTAVLAEGRLVTVDGTGGRVTAA